MSKEQLIADIEKGYTFKGDSMVLGTAMYEGTAIPGALVKAPLKSFSRHGLIAGATGTGKTITLQGIAAELAERGVSVLVMDIKGDLSGVSMPGTPNPKIEERHGLIGILWAPKASSVEFMTISEQDGVRLRATVSEFGPILLSKMLALNETQTGVVSIIFKFCDDKGLPLLDLKDFRKVLQYVTGDGKAEIESHYGLISSSSVGAIMRAVVQLESQGAEKFFGERSFDVNDLLRKDLSGRGYVNIIRLDDIQDRPQLFSTFMLCLLAEVYGNFPERGDLDAPELVIFIDEAHLVSREASKALLSQIESIIKLIRSKGVGIFFITQNPQDVPDAVLSQLGMKVQHALRAFTAKDREAIRKAAQNFPETEHYTVDRVLTQLGIGEALVTVLNEKGIPTPLVHTLLVSPASRMGTITEEEKRQLLRQSQLAYKYNEVVDRESAYEILTKKMEADQAQASREAEAKEAEKLSRDRAATTGRASARGRAQKSTFEKVLNSTTTRQIGRTFANTIARSLMGVLIGKK